MPDLRSDIIAKVAAGIAKLGTLNVDVRYDVTGVPVYDADTSEWTNPVESTHDISLIFSEYTASRSYSTDKLDDEVPFVEGDKVLIFSTTLMSVEPSIDDVVYNKETLISWRVLGVSGDPAGAHYELHVRPFTDV